MKIIKGVGKVVVAGIIAIAILSLIMCLYSLVPVHVENKKGNTDYVWPANAIWFKATEGISWGRFDANGFNNIYVIDNPDIIVLGSSHMEACEVLQNQTASYLLGQKLRDKYTVYNMGISGHDFYKVCQYIPANIELYNRTPKVIIIETSMVDIQREKVKQVLEGTVDHVYSYSTGLIGVLQRIPFIRAVYQQKEAGLLKLFSTPFINESEKRKSPEDEHYQDYNDDIEEDAYEEMFSFLSNIERKYGTQIIVFYHPTGVLNTEGEIEFNTDEKLEKFKQYSKSYDLNFVDMTESFKEMFYCEHHVAHGFFTGKLERGHLNAYGHATVAEALYEEILLMEESGIICQ